MVLLFVGFTIRYLYEYRKYLLDIYYIQKIYQCAEILKKSACIMKMVLRMKQIYEKICH